MGAVGIATGLAYSVLGLPSPLLLGVLAGIFEAIPMAGPLLGAIPALLVAATISPQLMLLVGLVYVAIQFAEGNILVPLVMRNTIGLSPFLVIVALLIGGAVGGIPGAFLAVPITAAVEVVLERLQAREAPVAEDPSSIQEPAAAKQRRMQASLPDSPGQAQADETDNSAGPQQAKARSNGRVDRAVGAQGEAGEAATEADVPIEPPRPRRRRGRAIDRAAASRP
jgi:hypothetical protein